MNEILHRIQQDLKAPKEQFNSFAKYKYRSCEDIIEAVKKILPKGVCLTLSDEIQLHGEFLYVVATARLFKDSDLLGAIVTTGCAREALEKKGMDSSQMTGTASSYARKYALNGLFAIDDTKDADTDEFKGKSNVLDTEARDDAKLGFLKQVNDKLDSVTSFKELDDSLTKEEKEYLKTKLSKIDPVAYKTFRDRYAALEGQFRKMAEDDLLNKYKEA